MAIKEIKHFGPRDFVPPASNAPAMQTAQNRMFLAFDASTKETTYSPAFRMPVFTGTLKVLVQYKLASATSGKVDIEVAVEAITEADAVNLGSTSSFDTANAANETVPGTAGYLAEIEITLTNQDSVAAGDMVRFSLARDAADGTNDTATGDLHILGMTFIEEI